ncbi:MAG TPA: DUF255 domain-containing protein [Crocinitomix sp.]|nr:DUF255 domain-containing protein [Crocinitomix sp.]
MKKILLSVVTVALIGFAFTNKVNEETSKLQTKVPGIEFFHGTWEEALAKSKKENKLIFMDAYASWCGPCKMMAKNTFTKEEVGDFFNKNFINVKMDMEKHKEGRRLSQKYGLRAYPTLYFINAKEEVKHVSIGYLKPKQLIEQGKLALQKK